jgi:uncharacterized protein YndB with AHSA1/START domain
MREPVSAREGYFVIADISGYTAFLAGTELEHAQGIIAELLTQIIESLTPPLKLVRPEGDAAFCCADESVFADPERLLELIEVTYFRFHQHLEHMARATTCTCQACASISTLDLKFVAHYGSYVIQQIAGIEEIAGAEVIVAHRLLKNGIRERTGVTAYAFLTDAVLARMTPLHLPAHAEEYESIGRVSGGVHDLRPVLAARRAVHRDYLTERDADLSIEAELPAPPEVVWPWLVDAPKVLAWNTGMGSYRNQANAQGRLGAGAESHCAHGSWAATIQYTDWRPYDYVTARHITTKKSLQAAPNMTTTTETLALPEGKTLYRFRIRADDRGLAMKLMLHVMGPMFRRTMRADLKKLSRLIEESGTQG